MICLPIQISLFTPGSQDDDRAFGSGIRLVGSGINAASQPEPEGVANVL